MSVKDTLLNILSMFKVEADKHYLKQEDVIEYNLVASDQPLAGYVNTYYLTANGIQIGEPINIPKDFLVKGASIETVISDDDPLPGFIEGDKYIDFRINTVDNDSIEDEHIYLNVKDLVDTYLPGNGINIDNNNRISVLIDANHANGLNTSINGLAITTASDNSTGALLATDYTKFNTASTDYTTVTSPIGYGNVITTISVSNHTAVPYKELTAITTEDVESITSSDIEDLFV